MTPLELLQAYRTRVGDALFGADYVDAPEQSINKFRQQPKTPADIRIKQDVGGQFTPKGGGKFQMPMFNRTPSVPGSKVQPLNEDNPPSTSRNQRNQEFRNRMKTTSDGIRIDARTKGRVTPKGNSQFRMPRYSGTPMVPGSGVQPLVNTNPIGLKPRPVYPGPAGTNIGGSGAGIKGGVVQTAAGLIGDKLIEMGSPEVIRGLMVVTGQDTSGYDRRLAGLPRVKNFGGLSYNIDTPEGLAAARKAREQGKKVSVPTRPGKTPVVTGTPPVDPGTPLVTLPTGLDTGSGSREARLDPNATVRYASNFKAGQANMSDIQKMYADRKDLQEWAKANPALAQKEYSKVMGKEKAADMAAYAEDYGSPMNQQSEMIFEQGKPTVTTTSQFDVINSPTELSAPGRSAYDLAMTNPNFIGQRDIPETDNTQEFLTAQMKKYGLVK